MGDNKGIGSFFMSNGVFERMVGLSDNAVQEKLQSEPLTQTELDSQLSVVPTQKIYSMRGAKIGWRETGDERGRGVFALEDIAKGELIEAAPVIVVAAADVPESGGAPDGYLLDWEPDEEGQEHCMPLGYIMLYNHSKNPTLYLENDSEELTISSFAGRDIKAGEELTWDYSCEIWFDEE